MYATINAIQAMHLSPNALVVEVGAGPGWLTQILVGLGYRVVAIEPSAMMNDLARRRISEFAAMMGVPMSGATFLTTTLEEADLTSYYGLADAVMFHESLHHVIDEREAIRQVFSLLQPGGCLAVCGEGRWNPGDNDLERQLDDEMKRYGTLESPFTQTYLLHLLQKAGFVEISFYHSVNGLFSESQEHKTIREVANPSLHAANTVLARRPAGKVPRLTGLRERTFAQITLLDARRDGVHLAVHVRLRNIGETYWPTYEPPLSGGVTLALTQDNVTAVPPEAANRAPLPRRLLPDEELTFSWRFDVRGLDLTACYLRLVAEDEFWFSGGLLIRI